MKRKNQKVPEQNQNITKQYAVSYAIIAFNKIYPKLSASNLAYKMISTMRSIEPKIAIKQAEDILNKNRKNYDNEWKTNIYSTRNSKNITFKS